MLSLLNTTFTTAVRRGVTVIGTLLSKLKARSTYFENKSGTKTTLQELEDDGLLSKASMLYLLQQLTTFWKYKLL